MVADTDELSAMTPPGMAPDDDMLTLTGMASALLRQRRLIAVLGVLGLVLAVAWSIWKSSYVAVASFTPAGQQTSVQGAASIAQAFGINLPGSAGGSPTLEFYVAVIRSRELMADLVRGRYRYATAAGDTVTRTLLQVYGAGSDTSSRAVLKAVHRLAGDVDVSSDETSNLVTVSVHAKAPGLAEAVGRRLLDLLNEFNIEQLQSRASAERRFVEQRRDSVRARLEEAEDSLRNFLERNRSVTNSPRLIFEQQRLQRLIDLRQQLYTSLAQAYEQARISEVRDTPVITVVDAPEGSALRQRHAIRNGAVGLILGLLLGLLVGLLREHLRRERTERPGDYSEFVRLRRQALGVFGGEARRSGG